jgi:lipoprotein-releasing system ATP-binding protein
MLIKIQNISKSYGTQTVLKNLSLEIEESETTAIVGPSGSGKTTLLNIIGAMDKPDSGSVLFKDRNIIEMNEDEQSVFRNQNIGFVFQMHYLLPQCSVLENVLIPTLAFSDKSAKKDAENRAKELIDHVGLGEHIHKLPGQLSGGECQRTAFIRALINKPLLILADEPTGSLDGETASILTDQMLELNKEFGTSLIVVTHSMQLAEKMNKKYHLKDHSVVMDYKL